MLYRVNWMQPSLLSLEVKYRMWKERSGGTTKMYQESLFYLLFTHSLQRRRQQIYPAWALSPEGWTKLPQPLLIHPVLQTPNISVDSCWSRSSLLKPFLCGEAQGWALDTKWQSQKREISHFSWPAGCTLYFNWIYFYLEYLMNTHRHWLMIKQFYLNCK